jgi:RNA polymerase sigma factor (sigma-70 family)
MGKKNTNVENDLKAVQEYRNGNQRGFDKLFNRYFDALVYRFRSSGVDSETAKDLAMQAFGKAAKALPSFDEKEGAFSTWLFRIASNTYIDHLRKNANYSVSNIDDLTAETEDGSFEFQIDSGVETPQQLMEREQRAGFAHRLIASISNDLTRQMVEMRYIDELSYDEIAELIGSPVGTVKGTLFRARETMAKKAMKFEMP